MQLCFLKILALMAPLFVASAKATQTSLHAEQPQKQGICYGKANGSFMPMRGNCAGFYMCVAGSAIASSCGPFYRFNAATGVCDHPDLVQCFDGSPDDDPNNYVNVSPMLPVMIGSDWQNFPAHIPKPQSPEEVIIDEAAGDICEQRRNGALLPHPDSCAHFYVCLVGRPYRRTCPPMLHFNAEKLLCQGPALAQCMSKPSSNPLAFELATFGGAWTCAGMPDGILLPHDVSCEKFFNCEEGVRIEMACPQGLHFSVRHQRCEWPKLARCAVLED